MNKEPNNMQNPYENTDEFYDDSHPQWDGNYPGEDDPANYEDCGDDYDTEDDSWSDGDSLASAGWGMDLGSLGNPGILRYPEDLMSWIPEIPVRLLPIGL